MSELIAAKVLKFEIFQKKRQLFQYKEACTKMGLKHQLLSGAVNTLTLDCMGKEVRVQDFCLKVLDKEVNFLRGYINKKMNEIVCEAGKSARLSILCDKKDKKYCKRPKKSCQKFRKTYAYDLKLDHHSVLENILNCHYEKRINENEKEDDGLKIDPDIFKN
jgi:hypothetical protein